MSGPSIGGVVTVLDAEIARLTAERVEAREAHETVAKLRAQIKLVADVLLGPEYDGRGAGESPCEMTVRVLREERAEIARLSAALEAARAEAEAWKGHVEAITMAERSFPEAERRGIANNRVAWCVAYTKAMEAARLALASDPAALARLVEEASR